MTKFGATPLNLTEMMLSADARSEAVCFLRLEGGGLAAWGQSAAYCRDSIPGTDTVDPYGHQAFFTEERELDVVRVCQNAGRDVVVFAIGEAQGRGFIDSVEYGVGKGARLLARVEADGGEGST